MKIDVVLSKNSFLEMATIETNLNYKEQPLEATMAVVSNGTPTVKSMEGLKKMMGF